MFLVWIRSGIFRTFPEPEIGRATRLKPTEGRTGRDHPRLGGEAPASTDDRNEKAPLRASLRGGAENKSWVWFSALLVIIFDFFLDTPCRQNANKICFCTRLIRIFDEVWYRIYDYQTFKKNSRENWQWIRKNTIVWLSHIHHAFQITLLVSEYKSTNYFSNRSIYRQESYYPAKEKDITDS